MTWLDTAIGMGISRARQTAYEQLREGKVSAVGPLVILAQSGIDEITIVRDRLVEMGIPLGFSYQTGRFPAPRWGCSSGELVGHHYSSSIASVWGIELKLSLDVIGGVLAYTIIGFVSDEVRDMVYGWKKVERGEPRSEQWARIPSDETPNRLGDFVSQLVVLKKSGGI